MLCVEIHTIHMHNFLCIFNSFLRFVAPVIQLGIVHWTAITEYAANIILTFYHRKHPIKCL